MALSITIAIATWNRCGPLEATLGCLAALRVPVDVRWDVVVCDNNSRDATSRVVARAAASLRDVVALQGVYEPRQGKSHALNRIIATSASDWLLFLDDDVRFGPDLLAAYVAGMRSHASAACFAGPIAPWLERPLRGHRAFVFDAYAAIHGALEVAHDEPMAAPDRTGYGANLMLRRSALPAEGFRTDRGMVAGTRVAGEDVMMQLDMLAAGHRGWLLAAAGVRHVVPAVRTGMGHFCRWQMGIGRGWVLQRGPAAPGRFGVPWWAWREMLRRGIRAARRWRPWPTRRFYDALAAASQYWGYLRASG